MRCCCLLFKIFINCKGVRLAVEMDVYEELLNVSFEDIKVNKLVRHPKIL